MITYRNFDYASNDDCQLLASWTNDSSIRHFFIPRRDEASSIVDETMESIREGNKKESPFRPVIDLMVLKSGKAIGQCDIIINPPHRRTREEIVAWFGIVIGASEYRGKGIGKEVLAYLEAQALSLDATHAEVGVFEFNHASIRLVQSRGYSQIARIEDFTHWNGRRWADLRFAKQLH